MRTISLLLSLFLLICVQQNGRAFAFRSARQSGLAGVSTTLFDSWTVFYNPAASIGENRFTAGLSSENRFLIREMQTYSFLFQYSKPGRHSGTLDISKFGTGPMTESSFGLSFSKKLGEKFSAGIRLSNHHWQAGSTLTPPRQLFTASIGFLAQPFTNVIIGTCISNPAGFRLKSPGIQQLPPRISTGIRYTLSEKVQLHAEVEKENSQGLNFKYAFEYNPLPKVAFRAGFASRPACPCFGFGLHWNTTRIEFASSFYQTSGMVPSVSLTTFFQ